MGLLEREGYEQTLCVAAETNEIGDCLHKLRSPHRNSVDSVPDTEVAVLRATGHEPSVWAEGGRKNARFVRENFQHAGRSIQRLLDADAVDGFFGGIVGEVRQRIGEPKQRSSGNPLIK